MNINKNIPFEFFSVDFLSAVLFYDVCARNWIGGWSSERIGVRYLRSVCDTAILGRRCSNVGYWFFIWPYVCHSGRLKFRMIF